MTNLQLVNLLLVFLLLKRQVIVIVSQLYVSLVQYLNYLLQVCKLFFTSLFRLTLTGQRVEVPPGQVASSPTADRFVIEIGHY